VADVKEILVPWDAGVSISGVAHSLGYSRPTVRKYVQAGQHLGLVRGSRRID
jgi:DNA-binding transcriptional regulator LsrR (DeoR family)